MLYLYFGDVEQIGVGEVYTCLDAPNRIGLKASFGRCPFDFSCLIRFGVDENVLSQFTFRHRVII